MTNWFQKVRDKYAELVGPKEHEYIDVRPENIEEHAAGMEGSQGSGFLSKLHHVSKRDQQIATLQAGYTELLDLVRSIREHLDKQGQAQEQIVASVDRFNNTLTLMDETSKRSSDTMAQMAGRARESETLLRTMLERSERRLVILICLLLLVTFSVLGFGIYFGVVPQLRDTQASRQAALPSYEVSSPGIATLLPSEELSSRESRIVVEELEFEDVVAEAENILAGYETPSQTDGPLEDEEKKAPGRRGFLFFRRN